MSHTHKSVADTLRAARALLEDPTQWTQWSSARNAMGRAVGVTSPTATQWCMVGALGAVDGPFQSAATDVLERALRGREITNYNDATGRRHKTILAAFDRAIALAEAQP